jgi:hypothetical protein
MRLIALVISTLLSIAPAAAAMNSYQCQVINDASISDDGKISIYPESLNIGQKFAVDRKTGIIIDNVFFHIGEPKVVSYGGKDSAFKVIWMEANVRGMYVGYLEVEEYYAGEKKPFFSYSGSRIMSGLCE